MLCQKFIIQIARHSIKSTDILKEDNEQFIKNWANNIETLIL